jgi:two-component system, NarL family, response regulator LiaR
MEIQDRDEIKVLVVDDHPVVRDGLKLFLSVTPGLACVGEAQDGEAAVHLCAELAPDVILMDMFMPGMDGITATRIIRNQYPQTQVIALTSFEDRNLMQQAIQAGAVSYLLKNSPIDLLAQAVHAAAVGRTTMSVEVIRMLVSTPSESDLNSSDLSEREHEVLCLLAEGLTNAAIAKKLNISEATARFHVSNILSKLMVSNRTEAVRLGIKNRLIT